MESLHDQALALCRACVESNLDTRMVFAVPLSTSAAEFQEKVRQYHMQNFPEHGDVSVTKLMVLLYGYWYTFTEGPVGVLARGDARFKAELEKKHVFLEKTFPSTVYRQPTVRADGEVDCVKCVTCQKTVRSLSTTLFADRDDKRHPNAGATTLALENLENDVQKARDDAGTTANHALGDIAKPDAVETAKNGEEAVVTLPKDNEEEQFLTGVTHLNTVQKPPERDSIKTPEAPTEQAAPMVAEPRIGEAVPEASTLKRKAESVEVSAKKLKLNTVEENISRNAGTGTSKRQDDSRELNKTPSVEKVETDNGKTSVQKDEVVKPTNTEEQLASQDGLQKSANSSRPIDLLMSQNVDDVCDKLITQHFSDSSISKSPIKKKLLSRKADETVKSCTADETRRRQKSSSDRSHAKQDPTLVSSLRKSSEARSTPPRKSSEARSKSPTKRAISSSSESSDEVEPEKLEITSKKASDVVKPVSDIMKPKQPGKASSAGGNSTQKTNLEANLKSPDDPRKQDALPESGSETESSGESKEVDAKRSAEEGVITEEQLPKGNQEKQKPNGSTLSDETTDEGSESESEPEAETTHQKSSRPTEVQKSKPSTGDLSKQKTPAASQDDRQAKPGPGSVSDDEESSSSESSSDSESPAPSPAKKSGRGNGSVETRFQHIFDKTDGLEQLINLRLSKRLEDTVVYETQDIEQELPKAEEPQKQQAAVTSETKKNAGDGNNNITQGSLRKNAGDGSNNIKQGSLKKTEQRQEVHKAEKQPEKAGTSEAKKNAGDGNKESLSKVKQSSGEGEPKQVDLKNKGKQQSTTKKSKAVKNAAEQTEASKKALEANVSPKNLVTPVTGTTPVIGSSTGTKRKSTGEEAPKNQSQKKQRASKKPPVSPTKVSCSICGKEYTCKSSAFYVHKKKCGT